MSFSFRQLHPTRRLWLVYYAAGHTITECCQMVPGVRGKDEPGIRMQTYEEWRKNDPLFLACMANIDDDADWCHEHIYGPWMLALDDLLQLEKALNVKTDPDRPWWGMTSKSRELLLNERGKLNRQDGGTADRFIAFIERQEERRRISEIKNANVPARLPAPRILDGAQE
jgi:hypothetical protein